MSCDLLYLEQQAFVATPETSLTTYFIEESWRLEPDEDSTVFNDMKQSMEL